MVDGWPKTVDKGSCQQSVFRGCGCDYTNHRLVLREYNKSMAQTDKATYKKEYVYIENPKHNKTNFYSHVFFIKYIYFHMAVCNPGKGFLQVFVDEHCSWEIFLCCQVWSPDWQQALPLSCRWISSTVSLIDGRTLDCALHFVKAISLVYEVFYGARNPNATICAEA